MVALLFCGIYLLYEVSDAFDVYENAYSTCVLEEATYPSSCVIVGFEAKFAWSAALIMATVREQLLFLRGSETTSDTNSLWVSEELPGVFKK